MKIVTGLEVVKENLLKSEMGIGYIQDGIDYIIYLEEEVNTLKEQLEYLKVRIMFYDKYA